MCARIHTHTQCIQTHTHTTASGKDAGLDHEYGLVDCITIVYISACDTTMPPRACDRGIHTHTIVQLALAWVDGRCSPTIPAHIAQECLLDAKLRQKFDRKRNKIDFSVPTRSLFAFSAHVRKNISKVYREIECSEGNHFELDLCDARHFILRSKFLIN